MTALRTILVFGALILAVIGASLIYRRTATPPESAPSAAAPTAAVDESELDPEFQAGLQALREKRDDDALQHFFAVTPGTPEHLMALQRIAVLQARKGDLELAQASIFRMTELRPDDPEPHATLGWLFYMAKDYDRAELAALRTLELDPNHLASRYNLGLYRVAQGRSQRAVASYLRAMREDPNGLEIVLHRERLQDFHDENPDSLAAHFALAFIANSMQDRELEVEELQHYLADAPDSPERDAAEIKLSEAKAVVNPS